jgi:hypothetical protein
MIRQPNERRICVNELRNCGTGSSQLLHDLSKRERSRKRDMSFRLSRLVPIALPQGGWRQAACFVEKTLHVFSELANIGVGRDGGRHVLWWS